MVELVEQTALDSLCCGFVPCLQCPLGVAMDLFLNQSGWSINQLGNPILNSQLRKQLKIHNIHLMLCVDDDLFMQIMSRLCGMT